MSSMACFQRRESFLWVRVSILYYITKRWVLSDSGLPCVSLYWDCPLRAGSVLSSDDRVAAYLRLSLPSLAIARYADESVLNDRRVAFLSNSSEAPPAIARGGFEPPNKPLPRWRRQIERASSTQIGVFKRRPFLALKIGETTVMTPVYR